MKLLVVGGAGFVGKVIRPALEEAHQVVHFDRAPVEGAEDRTIVADINDAARVAEAVKGIDALVYLAMGSVSGKETINEIDPAFDVNIKGFFRFASAAIAGGAKRIIYTSTLSVFKDFRTLRPFPENLPSDSWHVYGLTKRLGEDLCKKISLEHPEVTVLILRLNFPTNAKMWAKAHHRPEDPKSNVPLGPQDMTRAFLAAVESSRPGCHMMHIAGDVSQKYYISRQAKEIMGWEPRGE